MGKTKKRKKEKQIVSSNRISWDVWFFHSIINEDGFIISEPATVSLDGKKEKTMYGPRSPLFGTTYGDEQAFLERHRCKCGAFKGYQFRGETCPLCDTKIEAHDVDIKKTGWITLGEARIINPLWYKTFSKLIGKKVFPDILRYDERVDPDGNRHKLTEEDTNIVPLSPYSAIGIDGFYENYDEIMDYFAKKRKDKKKDFTKAKAQKSKAFTSHIPIYSTFLRPQSSTSDTFYYNGIDKDINPLVNLSESIKDCEPIERPYFQDRIQDRVNKMWEFNFELINHKEGFIRNKLIAGSLNWTSRCVIIPDPTLHADEIDLSYQGFRILFKYRIIYYLMKIDDIPLAQAYYRWKNSYQFDEHVHQIMSYIIKNEHPRIFLNRNPTLNLYSMLSLKIRRVKTDPYRTTLSVPLSILPGLNADFDGDILNMIALIEEEYIRMFRKFDPVERYIINRDTGEINKLFAITKGQLIDLYYYAIFDEDDDALEDADYGTLMDYVDKTKKEDQEHANRLQMIQ